MAKVRQLCVCCDSSEGCGLCATATFLPCVVFGTILADRYPDKMDKQVTCVGGASVTGLLWYSSSILGACAASMAAAGSGVLPFAADMATCWLVKQTLPPNYDNDCSYFCKSLFCTPCLLCQARAYQLDTKAAKTGAPYTMRAPAAMRM